MSSLTPSEKAKTDEPIESAMRERLKSFRSLSEQKTFVQLAKGLSKLPTERARAALEISAALASVNWRLSLDFLRAAPEAAQVLDVEALRLWSEIGKRLSVTDIERGAEFYTRGAEDLRLLPERVRALVFTVCARQMRLSVQIAVETLRLAPQIAQAANQLVKRELWLSAVFEVALEIAQRSAKHSADFLRVTSDVSQAIVKTSTVEATAVSTIKNGKAQREIEVKANAEVTNQDAFEVETVAAAAIELARHFAVNAGGIAADFWSNIPAAFAKLANTNRLRAIHSTERFLERGGAAALNVFTAHAAVLRRCPQAFDEWLGLLETFSAQGNSVLVAAARLAAPFFESLSRSGAKHERQTELAVRVLQATRKVAEVDGESAVNCFRSARTALAKSNIESFERWAREGLSSPNALDAKLDLRARRSYYALETRASEQALQAANESNGGLHLRDIAHTLQLYVEALTARAVEVAPLNGIPNESRIGDGQTIHLPSSVAEFDTEDANFRLYKVLAAHAAGQIEFGTRAQSGDTQNNVQLATAYASIAELHAEENVDALDAFSLGGYIENINDSERALTLEEERKRAAQEGKQMPAHADFRMVLSLFPNTGLAARIFSTLENGRIDRRLRHAYRGLRRDLDFVRERLAKQRPAIRAVPITLVPFELLFQITLCGGATEDARRGYSQIVSELETIVVDYLTDKQSSVADTLMATSRVYNLFQSVVSEASTPQNETESDDDGGSSSNSENQFEAGDVQADDLSDAAASFSEDTEQEKQQAAKDARELFNQWSSVSSGELETYDALDSDERWAAQSSAPEQALEAGETAYFYDEWDKDLGDYRVNWCRVVEKKVKRGDRNFVELARARYRGIISSLRYQFQLMRPEGLRRVHNELDGDDYNLESVVDFVIDRRTAARANSNVQPNERLYTKRLRRERDVAVAFLLDQSSSTARTIGRHPLQPYTHPGRRIIEIEKEGLVLMSEALESVGDAYAIYGFTSEGRRNVRFYTVKDFDERLTTEIERRIGGINFQHNTRLGAAIRHATTKLTAREARTHLLIVLTDGRPYDHDYGDSLYAREDTRDALAQARLADVTPFCITIDRNSEQELRDLYGEVGYTIIDDILSLPERMPMIYRRLTT